MHNGQVAFLEVRFDVVQDTVVWRAIGHWELPESSAESLAYHRIIVTALVGSLDRARIHIERFNWTMTATVKVFRGIKAEAIQARLRNYSLDDPARFDWLPIKRGKVPQGDSHGEG